MKKNRDMRTSVKLLLTNCLLFLGIVAYSQDVSFSFRYQQEELKDMEISEEMLKDHFLGYEIAKKMQLLKESYTYQEPGTATQPVGATVVEKPSIFYSVKKIERHLKKATKKEMIGEDDARAQLNSILDIALNIRYQETEKFEQILWDIKDPEEMATLYSSRVKLEM